MISFVFPSHIFILCAHEGKLALYTAILIYINLTIGVSLKVIGGIYFVPVTVIMSIYVISSSPYMCEYACVNIDVRWSYIFHIPVFALHSYLHYCEERNCCPVVNLANIFSLTTTYLTWYTLNSAIFILLVLRCISTCKKQ